ncbi:MULTISPECIES: glycosyltransferase family 2 protein [Arthrobacter]|uniref:Glycosyltransferase family 2 protein n=2 Tax=Arthrobacter TaxID=1663 RepID=A0ABU9KLP2_9MICC|nr:glycosyltransferase family 2 protein [Arthrobacter sp. YJM1]MDP5227727.1 glycosyltransferase family 2 protein [Arthrobacter sp. YJM1]
MFADGLMAEANLRFRTHVGYWRRVVDRLFDPDSRCRRRAVSAGMDIPRLPYIRRSVWAVSMVRNEADVIKFSVMNLLRQGVDAVLIADNLSTDETSAVLRRLAGEYPVYVAHDIEPAYFQAEKMTLLAEAAAKAGAAWVVPFDADEFWSVPSGDLKSTLLGLQEPKARATVRNVFPVEEGSLRGMVNGAEEILPKSAFRPYPGFHIETGNHFVDRPGREAGGITVLHFPWRSRSQIRAKSQTGRLALERAGHEAGIGSQWREMAKVDESAVEAAWRSLVEMKPWKEFGIEAQGPFTEIDLVTLSQRTVDDR